MVVTEFIVGIALLMLGEVMVLGRERIVARHQHRVVGHAVQSQMAWVVLGAILILAGLTQVVLAFA